ncbi:MAG: bifunctional phosphopantothenoylcysteine decarboxylase/phosphopantothenate--cysteine ligase CoaBC [Hydrogenobaculum sp.]
MNILIGITGGIACYKTLELIRLLKKKNHNVKTIMTNFAQEFISSMIVKTLSQNEVYTDSNWKEKPLCHIDLARWADVFLIAPCTINTLSKLRYGIADNLLTTTALAYKGYILLALSANTVMYEKYITKEHIDNMKNYNFKIIEPIYGLLACNEEGIGKMVEPEELLFYIYSADEEPIFKNKNALVIGGATKEYIDDVRFISNGSSGKMARYLTMALKSLGAKADFLDVSNMDVEKAYQKILEIFDKYHIVIMNAAISDYKVSSKYQGKIKKTQDKIVLELVKTKDILKELGSMKKSHQKLIGFALEEKDHLIENAKSKLISKNLDAIVANPISVMGSDEFEGFVITNYDVKSLPKMPKDIASVEILKALKDIL